MAESIASPRAQRAAQAENPPRAPWDLPEDIETFDEDDIDRLDDLDVHFGRHDWDFGDRGE